MPLKSASPNQLVVAWAWPVSLPHLGARVEAYAETKSSINTFRLVTRYSALSACHNLPEDVFSMIARRIRDMVYKEKMQAWIKINNCLSNTCTTMSHVSHEAQDSLFEGLSGKVSDDDPYITEHFTEDAAEQHQDDVWDYCMALSDPKDTSNVGRSVKIFFQDFGIRPYFMSYKKYRPKTRWIKHVEAGAYLTLPIMQAPIHSSPGLGTASFAIESVVHPSAQKGLSDGQLRQFRIAANVLRLRLSDCFGSDPVESHRNVDVTNRAGKSSKIAPNPTSDHAQEEASNMGAVAENEEEGKEEMRPQLMILGCGGFRAYQYDE